MKMFLNYYKEHFFYNAVITFGIGTIPLYKILNADANGLIVFKTNADAVITTYSLIFFSIGFLGSIFAFDKLKWKEYYFYFNKGLSKKHLFSFAFMANILIVILLTIILNTTGFIEYVKYL